MKEQRGSGALDRRNSRGVSAVPGPVTSWVLASVSVLVIATSYWLALQPGATEVQTGFVKWINDPPQPLGAVLAVTNSLFRPVPLAVVALALFGWMMFTARGKSRWEVLRAIVISFVLSEVITQILKRVAGQARPTASIPGLDVHGYPKDPYGNAYPSAHTSVVVGLVTALWPWLTWPQRVVGVAVAALVALNRLYIGAHWPVDVVGGAAIGLLSGSVCWLVAARWPIRRGGHPGAGAPQ
ncbi:MAG TPA: phosphatase PAP2 family protein [Polyangia bacterium]